VFIRTRTDLAELLEFFPGSNVCLVNNKSVHSIYTLSEAWSGVNWADLKAAQGAFGTDFYYRSLHRPKHRAYYRSGRPVIKIGSLGSHEIPPIHSAPSLGQSIPTSVVFVRYGHLQVIHACTLRRYIIKISCWVHSSEEKIVDRAIERIESTTTP